MVAPLIAAAGISAASSLAGSLLSHFMGESSKRQEYERQKEFAQHGVTWKVADAERAGIHPLAALGAQTTSYTPQAVYGSDFGLSDIGQNLAGAISKYDAKKQGKFAEWLDKTAGLLKVQGMKAENMRTQAEIERIYSDINIDRMRLANESLQRQPGNPHNLGGSTKNYSTPSSLLPSSGPVTMGSNAFEWNQTETPGVFRLNPTSDYAQKFEDKLVLEYTPFADSWRAGGFHGKTLQNMVWSPLHFGWINANGSRMTELKRYLQEKKLRNDAKQEEIRYRH